ncbi:T9SS type A sorting domain-containing protein [Hymenobacter setariae]|uniref:T9SS type A sorting domain-containing protein n=1 Tax=Hymenobacter setariae TaxID=2594794 RepID=A0A558BXM6_9BACT|nr:T9SS type A sorting domain-containing protein [Hymenobacter setariae]
MKSKLLLISGLIVLLAPRIGLGQSGAGCSGHFDIVYPAGSGTATTSTNNGSGSVTNSYCPPTAGTSQQIQVTPTSNSTVLLTRTLADNTVTTYDAGTVTGGATYTFVFPVATQSAVYKLTGTTVNCNNAKALNFSLLLDPTLALTASATTVCAGGSTVLTATGSTGSYTLTAPNTPTQTNTTGIFAVSPTVSTTYTVTAPTSCGTATQQQLTVIVPELTVSPAAATITLGGSVKLTATTNVNGAVYSWKDMGTSALLGTIDAPTLAPLLTTTYRVTSTVAGCSLSRDVPVTVQLTQPLPVTLSRFDATWTPAGPMLNWSTASETNNDYFAIERSLDGVAFGTIGRQAGAGTATTARAYQYADTEGAALTASTLYYRLRQVDSNGKTTYSPVRMVAIKRTSLTLFPNPASDKATLTGATPSAPVRVLDALGRVLLTTTTDAAGSAQLALPAGLPGGVYIVRAGQQATRLTVE